MDTTKPPKITEERNLEYLGWLVTERRIESNSERRTSCVFDGMTALEVKEALNHFHTNPQDLPGKKRFGAWLPANAVVKVDFDEGVLERRLYWAPERQCVDEHVSPKASFADICASDPRDDGQGVAIGHSHWSPSRDAPVDALHRP
ncbi:hypothetical protein LTR36_007125 [Oleoguttula mirabilis]|uniref:Uncharacterized protein n=1 Tax=Oleoguttula mirabilis TaxID=1507867 RepID=A0AAV9JBA9_9PEZI|nr:hypothetical protein LTR36_007125 [Oleoguttula mirabilis]